MWLSQGRRAERAEGAAPPIAEVGGPRVFLYSHDTYGLGHFRRNLLIARALARLLPDISILCATGSPRSHSFPLPPRFDYLKLPSTTKDGNGGYRSRTLSLSLAEVTRLRAGLLREAVLSFRPDLLLVDHAPLGMAGELLPTLRAVRRRLPETRLVLGLRDIVDEPEKIRKEWARRPYRNALEDLYDRILVYGDPQIFDLPHEYGLTTPARAKIRFTGYVAPNPSPGCRRRVRAALRLGRRPLVLVLVLVGGGGDGGPLLRAYLRALEEGEAPRFVSLLVAGPFLSPGKRARLRAAAARREEVRLLDFAPNVPDLVAASDLVVSMAGYNSACEILASGVRAILVPRVRPRLEQFERASRLAALGLVRLLHPDGLRPVRLREAIEEALAHPPTLSSFPVDLSGGENVAAEVCALLPEPAGAPHNGGSG